MEQKNYNICRFDLRKKLRQIAKFYPYDNNFNVQNLLFPNGIFIKPLKQELNYKQITNTKN